jgi:hypothetical protein
LACSYCGAPKVIARGLCMNCYQRQRNRGTLERAYGHRVGHCSVDGCDKAVEARGLCEQHYAKSRHPMTNSWKLLRSRWPGQYPPSWERFAAFLADVGERPSPKHQLRKIDTRIQWSGENAQWVAPVSGGRNSQMSREAQSAYGREWKLQRHYKITGADYDAMFAAQGGVCAICGDTSKTKLAIDHCHTTGRIRGLLCISCNRGIGYLGDDPDRALRASEYLRSA